MRKILSTLLAAVIIISAAGCSGGGDRGGALSVIVTTDALYELTSAVAGDRIAVTCLLSGGEEIHHFEPTAKDAEALAKASLIICNGLGLDDWASELASGTQVHAAAEHVTDLIPGDPHVWLSPDGACGLAEGICSRLTELDAEGAETYADNCLRLCESLNALSDKYAPLLAAARLDTFVTGHAALGYLAREFGLTQKSVSDVFSASEPSARQLQELTDFCSANGVTAVLSESAAPRAVSETLARECGAEVLPVYMMESAEDGLSFTERMEHNLETVLTALS